MNTCHLEVGRTGSGKKAWAKKSPSVQTVFLAMMDQWRFAKSSGTQMGAASWKQGREGRLCSAKHKKASRKGTSKNCRWLCWESKAASPSIRPLEQGFCLKCQDSPISRGKQPQRGMGSFELNLSYQSSAKPGEEDTPGTNSTAKIIRDLTLCPLPLELDPDPAARPPASEERKIPVASMWLEQQG